MYCAMYAYVYWYIKENNIILDSMYTQKIDRFAYVSKLLKFFLCRIKLSSTFQNIVFLHPCHY